MYIIYLQEIHKLKESRIFLPFKTFIAIKSTVKTLDLLSFNLQGKAFSIKLIIVVNYLIAYTNQLNYNIIDENRIIRSNDSNFHKVRKITMM